MNDQTSPVQVAIRIRPLSEKESSCNKIITYNGSNTFLLQNTTSAAKVFTFDYVFDENASQQDVYEKIGKSVIHDALSGYNSCVFAYGQTGCFAKGTPVIHFDGHITNVEDVKVGDVLMGDDHKVRKVKFTVRGREQMYQIASDYNEPYEVNENHLLVLQVDLDISYFKNKNKWMLKYYSIDGNCNNYKRFSTEENLLSHVRDLLAQPIIRQYPVQKYLALNKNIQKHLFCFSSPSIPKRICVHPILGLSIEERKSLLDQILSNLFVNHSMSLSLSDLENIEKLPLKIEHKNYIHYHKYIIAEDIFIKHNHHQLIKTLRDLQYLAGTLGMPSYISRGMLHLHIPHVSTEVPFIKIDTTYNCAYSAKETTEPIPLSDTHRPDFTGRVATFSLKDNIRYFIPKITKLHVSDYYGFGLDGNRMFLGSNFHVLRNSGKTYTMMEEDSGLIYQICKVLSESKEYKIQMSYYEIYCEEIRDLLSNDFKPLRVCEHPKLGVHIVGLSTPVVDNNYKMMKSIIQRGNRARTTASTLMNNRSSRSHAILSIYISKLVDTKKEIKSVINLVDLAGSEKIEMSGVTGIHKDEAININASLSTLGRVISQLAIRKIKSKTLIPSTPYNTLSASSIPTPTAEFVSSLIDDNLNKLPSTKTKPADKKKIIPKPPKKEEPHIAFRDSILTRVLSESLGGNSKTYMIATISPASINYEETLSTIRYAQSAKRIINRAKINEERPDEIIQQLKNEIEILRTQLKSYSQDQDVLRVKKLEEELRQREYLILEKEKTWEQKLQESQKLTEEETKNKIQISEELRRLTEEYEKLRSTTQNKYEAMNDFMKNCTEVYQKRIDELEKALAAAKSPIENAILLDQYKNSYEILLSDYKMLQLSLAHKDKEIAELQEIKKILSKKNALLYAEPSKR